MPWKRSAAYALVRVVMGVVFFFAGMGKILGGVRAFSEGLTQNFSETMLPGTLVSAFGMVLPFAEVALGVLLLVGLFTAPALLLTGCLLVVLTLGTVLNPPDASVVPHNVFYTLVVAVLLWLETANTYALDRFRARSDMGPPPARADVLPPIPRAPSRHWVARQAPRGRSRVEGKP